MSPLPLLEIAGLEVSAPGRRLARADALTVRAGDVIAVSGPSGAGKSSLLRGLVRLAPTTAATFHAVGHPIPATPAGIRALRRNCTLVPQAAIPFPGTASDNLRHAAWLSGHHPPQDWATRGEAAFKTVGLPRECWEQSAATLSIGQRMRLAIARALVVCEHVLLLDEPFAALDPDARTVLREGLARWVVEGDRALVVIVHDPELLGGHATQRWTLDAQGTVTVTGEVPCPTS